MMKAVFFDLYNTLVDYDPPREEVQAAICREFGIEVAPEALRRAIPAADDFFYEENARSSLGKRTTQEKYDLYAEYESRILRGVGVEVSKEVALNILAKFGLKLRQPDAKLVLFDDVAPTLARLKGQGLTLGLITNVDYDIAPICDRLGLSSYLDFLVTSQEVGAGKPDPAIFYAALRRAGVKASEAIHVGDQYHADVLGARNAGIKPLLLDRDDFYREVADCPRINSLTEVVEHLL
jgi:putative hydrolase of the HAD superfamily